MGSTLSDFFSQIPSVIFLPFCASAVLLVIVLTLIVNARAQRSRSAAPAPPPLLLKGKRSAAPAADSDLPDLDILVDITTLASPLPPEPVPAAAPPRPAQAGVEPLTLSDGAVVQAVEVLRVLRDITGGGLVVQMGDRAYRTLAQDEAFRADFLKLMRELSPLVRDAAPPTASAPPPKAASAAAPDAAQPPDKAAETETPSLSDLLAARTPKRAFTPPPMSDGELPGDLPRFSLDNAPTLPPKSGLFRRQKREALPPVPELNIASAIEAYVQHRLQLTPELAGHSVHIHPSTDGGVVIEADGVFYNAVDAVEDDEVRQFLTMAIAEWQSRLK
ncbi:MAG: hypothetical protein ACUVSX_06010 [Aggregatilineales bacterium]